MGTSRGVVHRSVLHNSACLRNRKCYKMYKVKEVKELNNSQRQELITFDKLLEESKEKQRNFVASDESTAFCSPLARENDLCAPKISFQYLLDITQNFHQSNQIGEGGFSQVFQGITHNRKIHVAVKKMKIDTFDFIMQINHNIDQLPRFKHPNIIDLLAYCNESRERLCLVYPYMKNGSLKKRLDEKDLTFEQKKERSLLVLSKASITCIQDQNL